MVALGFGQTVRAVTFEGKWGTLGEGNYGFHQPVGVAVGPTGDIYVADQDNGRIQVFTEAGIYKATLGHNPRTLSRPSCVLVDPAGYAYVSDGTDGIKKFRPNGTFFNGWRWRLNGTSAPLGLALTSPENGSYLLVVIYHSEKGAIVTDPHSGAVFSGGAFLNYEPFYWPEAIALAPDGDIYVADAALCRIEEFDSEHRFVRAWGKRGTGSGEFQAPSGLAVGAHGEVYVADKYNDRIQVFSADGVFQESWGERGAGNGKFYWPTSVAYNTTNGEVYVADSLNNRIQRFKL